MSKRPWPDDAHPTADQLLDWCRTGMTADVTPYLRRLIDDAAAMHDARMRGRLALGEVLDVLTHTEAQSLHEVVVDDTAYVAIPRLLVSKLLEQAMT